jgi:acyl-CoA synthetase (AMP-forming)/AMP-acid ligase II
MGVTRRPRDKRSETVGNVLDWGLERDPTHEALVSIDARLTYEALDFAVERAASALSTLGIGKDDVVAVSLPNESAVVVTFHALMRLGAVWVGVNQNLAPPEKAFILHDSEAQFLLTNPGFAASLADDLDVPLAPKVPVVSVGTEEWASRTANAPTRYRRPLRQGTDVAAIAYTSGTTGRPKGVLHSHQNLLLPGAMLVRARRFGPELRKGDCAALTILNMQVTSTLLVAQAGGTQIVMDRIDPIGVAHWVRTESVNSWFGVPTTLQGLVDATEVKSQDLRTLSDIWTGGTHLPPFLRNAFATRFGHRISATYGMTEVPTVVTIEAQTGSQFPGSSGQALPHLLVEIRDGDDVVQPPGEIGEITVRAQDEGPWAEQYRPMLGYLGHPEATAATIRDEILRTGDIGHLDELGNLFVHDRGNALILRGGANVYPAEVERVLLQFGGVSAASVVGVPDDRLGQRVAAVIEAREGAMLDVDALRSYCTSQLARYKVPELWDIGSLPRNAMGKVSQTEVVRRLTNLKEAATITNSNSRAKGT